MKKTMLVLVFFFAFLGVTQSVLGQGTGCSSGKRPDGVYYTDCYPRVTGAPYYDTNDTRRLQAAVTAAYGKLVFNEGTYDINDQIVVHGNLIIEGFGRDALVSQSVVRQNAANKAIFFIGEGIHHFTIQDITLLGNNTGTIGIKAEGGSGTNDSTLGTTFSRLTLQNHLVGIKVNATNGYWQFDNVKLDNSSFNNCHTGVYVHSANSGWEMSSLGFSSPTDGIGIDADMISYTTMNLLVGGGPGYDAETFIRVGSHAVLNIRNTVAEGYDRDLIVTNVGSDRSEPIFLTNNDFLNGVEIADATVVSIANQFGHGYTPPHDDVPVIASGYAQVTSIGDKFCQENAGCETKSWEMQDSAQMIFSTNQFLNTTSIQTVMKRDGYDSKPLLYLTADTYTGPSLLRLGKGSNYFDVTRSDIDGTLTFASSVGYGYTFDTAGGTFKIENGDLNFSSNKTITLGTSAYSGLGASANGTLFYCSNCTATASCAGGGSGAIAKRINSAWVCN